MNGPHDLGGRHGFGAVAPEIDEPPWHHDWEARMHVMALACQVRGFFVLDEQRHACEQLPPVQYLHGNYYERWNAAVTGLLVGKCVLNEDEFAVRTAAFLEGTAAAPATDRRTDGLGDRLVGALRGGASAMREPVGKKAWTDPEYRARLMADASSAIDELGFRGLQTEHVVAVENTPTVHHMVVCTLCSCYPWMLLGIPPTWFKDPQYRSRSVIEPRKVLADFGVELGPDVEVTVWDTSAEVRYLVVPERPGGTEGFSEQQLVRLVTRDSMLGLGFALAPQASP